MSKDNRLAPNSQTKVVINVGLIKTNKKSRTSRTSSSQKKLQESSHLSKLLVLLWIKHADHDQFLCGSDEYVLCYPGQSTVLFISGTNIEFTVERYKEEQGKQFLKIDLYLCHVNNVDRDANLKVNDGNKATIHGNSNQTISNQLTHEQNTDTNPTQNTNILSLFDTRSTARSEAEPFQWWKWI